MSIHLTIDEMLDILKYTEHPKFERMKERAEELGTALAAYVADAVPELLMVGFATFQSVDFGGTCAPFRPRDPGPVPAVLADLGREVQEWIEMSDALAEGVRELTGINHELGLVTESGP